MEVKDCLLLSDNKTFFEENSLLAKPTNNVKSQFKRCRDFK